MSSASFLDDKRRGPAFVTESSSVVDVAALSEKLTPIVQETGHVVNTTYIPIGIVEFKNLFYSVDGEHFQINQAVCNQHNLTTETKELYNKISFSNKFSSGPPVQSFNLIEHVIKKYEEDLGVSRECWEPCSVIEMEALLGGLAAICDVGDGCQVDCALKWSEVEAILTQKRVSSCYGESLVPPDCAVREILVISVILKSSNPDVQNCTVKFRFAVDWCCDPCMNPWLTHYVDGNSAIGAMFFSTQQAAAGFESSFNLIPVNLMPTCFESQSANTELLGVKNYKLVNPIGKPSYTVENEDLDKRAVQITSNNMYVCCEDSLYGRPVTDPLDSKQLSASNVYNFSAADLKSAPIDHRLLQQNSNLAGMIQGVSWTTNPCGGNPNKPDSPPGGVWKGSWPLPNGKYEATSDYAGGKNVTNWFWYDWTHYLISIKFPKCGIVGQPPRPVGESLYVPHTVEALGSSTDIMIPLSFKWLPWVNSNCTAISFKYWCDYKVMNDIPSQVDVYGEKVLPSNRWLSITDGYVLPIFNDSSKTPRLELLVPANNDSGNGETVTTYVFDFCVSEENYDALDCSGSTTN